MCLGLINLAELVEDEKEPDSAPVGPLLGMLAL
jgi:hypothetical protein